MTEFLHQIYISTSVLNCRTLFKTLEQGLLALLSDNSVLESIKPSVALLISALLYKNCRKLER